MKKINKLLSKVNQKIPTREEVFRSKWFKPIEPYFNKYYFWSINRKNVALAVAVGLFCGLMPGPTQMLSAFIVAYLLRTNISIAIFTTLYTNPFTYIPLYYLAYKIGFFILDGDATTHDSLSFSETYYWNFQQFMDWFNANITYFLVGVPTLGLILAISGYFLVLVFWRGYINLKLKANRAKKKLKNPINPNCH